MVKNGKGGNKGKKIGRKYLGNMSKGLRVKEDECEIYAVVVKLFGGPNCEVCCEDGKNRLCIIRNKFRGRGKRGNEIRPGVWVMVGSRDWESSSNSMDNSKLAKCDLLEVYDDNDKKKLMNDYNGGWSELIKAEGKVCASSLNNNNIILNDDIVWDTSDVNKAAMNEINEELSAVDGASSRNKMLDDLGDEIDIDEI